MKCTHHMKIDLEYFSAMRIDPTFHEHQMLPEYKYHRIEWVINSSSLSLIVWRYSLPSDHTLPDRSNYEIYCWILPKQNSMNNCFKPDFNLIYME